MSGEGAHGCMNLQQMCQDCKFPPQHAEVTLLGGFAPQRTSAKKGEFAQIGNKLSRRALTTTQNGEWGTENSQ
jgi:hypothetical protein